MTIEGHRLSEPRMVPVFEDGKRTEVHPERIKPYSLDVAQELVRVVRSSLNRSTYQVRRQLVDQIAHLEEFARGAQEVIDAGQEEVKELQTRRKALHSSAPAEKFDAAIANLEIHLKRHARMKYRILETVARAHRALALWRDPKKMQIQEPNSHPETDDLRREIKALRRGEPQT